MSDTAKDSIDIMASMLNKLTEDEKRHLNAILHLAREQLEHENAELRKVCAEAYQVAGCAGAPVRVLDNLSCAANNRPIPHETMLPVLLKEFDEVAELRKKLEWQPIETAPRTGIALLLAQPWRSGYDTRLIGHYANGWVIHDGRELWDVEPTHWMPLPEPPL